MFQGEENACVIGPEKLSKMKIDLWIWQFTDH